MSNQPVLKATDLPSRLMNLHVLVLLHDFHFQQFLLSHHLMELFAAEEERRERQPMQRRTTLTDSLELPRGTDPCCSGLGRARSDSVARDCAAARSVDSSPPRFVRIVARETRTAKSRLKRPHHPPTERRTSYFVIRLAYSALIFAYFI